MASALQLLRDYWNRRRYTAMLRRVDRRLAHWERVFTQAVAEADNLMGGVRCYRESDLAPETLPAGFERITAELASDEARGEASKPSLGVTVSLHRLFDVNSESFDRIKSGEQRMIAAANNETPVVGTEIIFLEHGGARSAMFAVAEVLTTPYHAVVRFADVEA